MPTRQVGLGGEYVHALGAGDAGHQLHGEGHDAGAGQARPGVLRELDIAANEIAHGHVSGYAFAFVLGPNAYIIASKAVAAAMFGLIGRFGERPRLRGAWPPERE